jgi:hypothetical protein
MAGMYPVDIHLLAAHHHLGRGDNPSGVVEGQRRLAEVDRRRQPLLIPGEIGGQSQFPLVSPRAVNLPLQGGTQYVVPTRGSQRHGHRPTFGRRGGQEIEPSTPLFTVDIRRQ